MRCSSIAYGAVAVACLACVDATAPNREVLPSGPVRAVAAAVDPNYPNEPAGLTLVSERPFNAKATTTTDVAGAEGWSPSEASYASLTIVSDNTAPKSPANVAQILFPSGFVGGSAPAVAAKSIGAPYRRLYVSVWLQLSATWQGPQYNAVNRIFSLWAGGKQRIAFMARGRGTGTLVPAVQLLQTADSRTRLDPNLLTSATVARGTWQRWEMVVTMNTPGTADGEVHWWVDGTKIAEYRNVQFVGASEADVWSQLRWNPVWGSSSDKVPSAMTMRWDHIFISGSESRTDSNPPPPDDSTGTSSTAIFSEGFESGSLAQWQDGVDPTKQRVITDASLAHSGTHVLEVTYPQGADGGWLTRFFMPGYDSVYVSAWFELADNWVGATKLLALYGSRIDDQWSAFGNAGQCPNGADFFATMLVTEPTGNPGPVRFYTYYPAMAREPDGVTCYGRFGNGMETYFPPLTLSAGAWHKLEFWVKLNAPGRSDFDEKFWIDGVLRGDWPGISLRSTTDLRLNSVQLAFSYGNANNASPQTQKLYVDDILVSTALPSESPLPPPPPPPPPPAAVASVTVSPASASVQVGQTVQLSALTSDASGNVLTGRAVTWTSGNTAIATISSGGTVTGVAAGQVTVTATSEGVTGQAAIAVTAAAPPPDGVWPNEPAGFQVLTDQPWNGLASLGWQHLNRSSYSHIVQDATAPLSPQNVLEDVYPAGFQGGLDPAVDWFTGFTPTQEIYVGFWYKHSPNFESHPVGNKLAFIWSWTSPSRDFIIGVEPPPGWPLVIVSEGFGIVGDPSAHRFYPNVGTGQCLPGIWHRIEVYVKNSSPLGATNGILKFWVDGQLAGSYTNVLMPVGTAWNQFEHTPTWGGIGSVKTRSDYVRYDHTHISRP